MTGRVQPLVGLAAVAALLAACGSSSSPAAVPGAPSVFGSASASAYPSAAGSASSGSGTAVAGGPGGTSVTSTGAPGGPIGGARSDARSWSNQPASVPAPTRTTPVRVVSLRSAPNEENGVRYERLVVEFTGGTPGYQARYVTEVIRPGSGAPLPLVGQAQLELVLSSATAHDDQGASTLRTASSGQDAAGGLSYAVAGDFEGMVHIGVGMARVTDFRVVSLTSPDRLAIDFRS
ncbi:hypothetical protein [Frankia sp. R82]|uniref:AMIN-like domain-containing (lipo)protein n=1 Tax=Frankia sp. R82 TaxID=2950553 RepID=UPI0020430D3A|nr:hypothetical protein [Frankia sp. R82]MCM3885613.1 hypothetical protein [Frankia sp. R82]